MADEYEDRNLEDEALKGGNPLVEDEEDGADEEESLEGFRVEGEDDAEI